jgi:hypothetical protein
LCEVCRSDSYSIGDVDKGTRLCCFVVPLESSQENEWQIVERQSLSISLTSNPVVLILSYLPLCSPLQQLNPYGKPCVVEWSLINYHLLTVISYSLLTSLSSDIQKPYKYPLLSSEEQLDHIYSSSGNACVRAYYLLQPAQRYCTILESGHASFLTSTSLPPKRMFKVARIIVEGI